MNIMVPDRIRKSEKLTLEEYEKLVAWVAKQLTKMDAAFIIGISREVLDRVLVVRSGSPATIFKIRAVLAKDAGTEPVIA